VAITPTYSGCPALEVMREDILAVLHAHGYAQVSVTTVLAPAWTTDWMSEQGRRKLREYGIAPPGPTSGPVFVALKVRPGARALEPVACPQCGSTDTQLSSRFGSTPCKALYTCAACREPFDYFKPL
jgi:ring-1,2-phenylacetyl-CoA epoxidase subunit PaaD